MSPSNLDNVAWSFDECEKQRSLMNGTPPLVLPVEIERSVRRSGKNEVEWKSFPVEIENRYHIWDRGGVIFATVLMLLWGAFLLGFWLSKHIRGI